MRSEVITDLAGLQQLTGPWEDMAARNARDGFFRTPAWYMAWVRHIRPSARPHVVVVYDGQQRVVGIAPMCRYTYADLGFRLDAIGWAGRDVVSGDFLGPVCDPALEVEVRREVLTRLLAGGDRCALLVLSELVQGSADLQTAQEEARRIHLRTHVQEIRTCPYIPLPGTFDDYLATLSSSTRYHIRRRLRDVEKSGATVLVLSDPAEVASQLPHLIRLHTARWNADHLPGTLTRPGMAAFLEAIAAKPPAGGSCRLYVLRAGDEPVAALLVFHYGESCLYYQAGWSPERSVAQLSPAVVLMAYSIRDAITSGCAYYEFLRGDEGYKSKWTKSERTTATLLIARSWTAEQYLRVVDGKDAVKRLLSARRTPPPETAEANL